MQLAFTLPAHEFEKTITSMAVFNLPDGPKILTASIDQTIRVSARIVLVVPIASNVYHVFV